VIREQARGWDDRGLATAITAVAQADADVKGAASDPAYALERMVLKVTGARVGR
jgi:DNA polymerase-3 subunit delta